MKKEPLFKVNPANPNQRHNFIITDFVANYEDSADDLPTPHPAETRGCCRSLCAYLRLVNPSYWAFLALLGLLTAFLSFFIDYSSQELRRGKPASQPASQLAPSPSPSPSLTLPLSRDQPLLRAIGVPLVARLPAVGRVRHRLRHARGRSR